MHVSENYYSMGYLLSEQSTLVTVPHIVHLFRALFLYILSSSVAFTLCFDIPSLCNFLGYTSEMFGRVFAIKSAFHYSECL